MIVVVTKTVATLNNAPPTALISDCLGGGLVCVRTSGEEIEIEDKYFRKTKAG